MAADPLILLAGGKSERMGTPKGLLDFHGRTWLEEQIRRAGEREVIVAQGFFDYSREVGVGARVRSIRNPDPSRGPFSTLWAAVQDMHTAAWILPIDVPLEPQVLTMQTRGYAVIPTHQGRGGHPVWLSSEAVSDLRTQNPGTARLDHFLRERSDLVARIEVPFPDVTRNLNTPEAWSEYVRSHRREP